MIKIQERDLNDPAAGLIGMGRDETATLLQQKLGKRKTKQGDTQSHWFCWKTSASLMILVLDMLGEPEKPPTGPAEGRVKA